MRKDYFKLPDDEFFHYQECYIGFVKDNERYITYLKKTDFEKVAPKMITIYRCTVFDTLRNIFTNNKWLTKNDCKEKDDNEKFYKFKYLFGNGYILFNYLQVQDIQKMLEVEKKTNKMFNQDLGSFYEEMGIEEDLDTIPTDIFQKQNFPIQKVDGEYKLLQYNFVNDYKDIDGIVGCLINLDNETLEIYSEKLEGLDTPYVVDRDITYEAIDSIFEKLEVKEEWRVKKMKIVG